MVKQYSDGYYVNGKWFSGKFYELINEAIEKQQVINVIDEPHLKPIKVGQMIAQDVVYDVVKTIPCPAGWCEHNQIDPLESSYMHYLLMGILTVVVLLLAFMVVVGLL